MALNSIFGIAKSSLFAHQQALSVTSTNLANANNPAYSRQVVMFGATPPDHRAVFSFGTGVAVDEVLRIRNQVTDTQIRANNQNYYDANKRSSMLKQVESMFSEPSEYGLSNLINSFFNSWDELAVDPLSSALRTNIVQSAQTLSEKIESIHKGISQTKIDVKNEAGAMVDTINGIVEQIHITNKQIYEASVVDHYANDLIDKRESLIDELSQYASINVYYDKNNVANVSIGGMFAVDGLHHVTFDLVQDGETISLMNEEKSASATLQGGELNGLLKIFNDELPDQLEKLNILSTTLMDNVNSIHEQGHTLTNPSKTGIKFFSHLENGVLYINEEILKDGNNIAASSDGTSGDNKIALLMAELQNSEVLDGNTLSVMYSELISGIANEINLQEQNAESYSLVLNQLQNQKAEYSGVSTDEEMVNVMQYQRSYDAAAKLINVADELLETLINLV
ncbi:MAG: flagellar hook-associated protein FlgK [Ignavibacteriae bacterium]|nr:flagellar hook-associated protein FlgK [Ignavibacteriota bacterium]